MVRRMLVTTALPYANGLLHLGHLLEHIQSDIWARFQRLRGHECYFICGSDAHGTPIMLNAEKQGMAPETLIEQVRADHIHDLESFEVYYDTFHTTHSPENRVLAENLYRALKAAGDIEVRSIEQAFDTAKNLFLPDRYVKGNCPKCNTPDQYGDACEHCGAAYSPRDLKNPISVLSGTSPAFRHSEHYFFNLPRYEILLREWLDTAALQPSVANKLREWFNGALEAWDISRDAPYFGFEIPDAPGKYFYVWLDAPIGYMASFQHYCAHTTPELFNEFWKPGHNTELYHFVGKDIIYFHGLFWPALLAGGGYRLPTNLFAHGFLTIQGQKMSKSRGTFMTVKQYQAHLNPLYLRYYFAAKLNDSVEDIDLNWDDFSTRVNSDLVGKWVNIASRCSHFIETYFDGKLSAELWDRGLYDACALAGDDIAEAFENREYSRAIRDIMHWADETNRFIDAHKPWAAIKNSEERNAVQAICTTGLNLFKLLALYLKPVLPSLLEKVEAFLACDPLDWSPDSLAPLLDQSICPFIPLLQRVDVLGVQTMLDEAAPSVTRSLPLAAEVGMEDFNKIDLRVAKILNAETIPEADKLIKLTVDIGDNTPRTIFSGIKAYFEPADLIGKMTLVIANLAPRKMRFGVSEGMLLLAGGTTGELFLLEPQSGAEPGMKVK